MAWGLQKIYDLLANLRNDAAARDKAQREALARIETKLDQLIAGSQINEVTGIEATPSTPTERP